MHIGIRKGIRGRWGLFILLLVFLWPVLALALSASQVFEQVKDSVVVVKALDRQGKQVGLGSGVVLPSGEVATNHHVAAAGERLQVGAHGRYVPAFLLASDPERDLALLLAPGLAATPARLGRAGGLKVGDKVFAVGAPYGLELSLSEGIVSQLRGGPPALIQTTAPISPGSSGGGLFNDRGELVGLTTFYLKGGQGLNFALPVEFLTELAAGKKHKPPARAGPVTPPGPAASGDWENQAAALLKSQDWHGLLAHCRRWTQAQPDNNVAYYYLGFVYHVLDRHREAVEAYREALRLKPDDAMAWNNLGVSYGKSGRWQEAVEAFREALRLKPDDAEAWLRLGFSYSKLGRWQEAVEAFREAVRLKPDFAEAWGGLGVAYFISGNRSAALEAVKELRRYDSQKADELFNLIMKP
jgi:Flp pilus assembly protein TadD